MESAHLEGQSFHPVEFLLSLPGSEWGCSAYGQSIHGMGMRQELWIGNETEGRTHDPLAFPQN